MSSSLRRMSQSLKRRRKKQHKHNYEFDGGLVRIELPERVKEKEDEKEEKAANEYGYILGHLLKIYEFNDPKIYKSAIVEFFASFSLFFMSLCLTTSPIVIEQNPPSYIAIGNGILITLHILAAGPASGGHINPLITLSTLFTGLASLPRAFAYICCQLLGATVAGYFFRIVTNGQLGEDVVPIRGACSGGDLSIGQQFLLESSAAFCLLFVAYGTALDPKQGQVMGPIIAPILIGFMIALVIYGTAGLAVGATGAGVNPGRCFAGAVAGDFWERHWIYWVAIIPSIVVLGLLYRLIPPHFQAEDDEEDEDEML